MLVGDGSEKPRLMAEASKRGAEHSIRATRARGGDRGPLCRRDRGACDPAAFGPDGGSASGEALAIMACGRAVLYSGAGEGADLVTAAGAGVVVPPEDPIALAGAARALVANPDDAVRRGRVGGVSWRRNSLGRRSWATGSPSSTASFRGGARERPDPNPRLFRDRGLAAEPGRHYLAREPDSVDARGSIGSTASVADLAICDVGCGGGADLLTWRELGVPEEAWPAPSSSRVARMRPVARPRRGHPRRRRVRPPIRIRGLRRLHRIAGALDDPLRPGSRSPAARDGPSRPDRADS